MAKKKRKLETHNPIKPNHISINSEVYKEYEEELHKYMISLEGSKLTYASDSDFIAHLLMNNNASDTSGALKMARERDIEARAKMRKKKTLKKPDQEIRRFEILLLLCQIEGYGKHFRSYMDELNQVSDDYGYDYEEEKDVSEFIGKTDYNSIFELIMFKAIESKLFLALPELLVKKKNYEYDFRKDFKNDMNYLYDKTDFLDMNGDDYFITEEGIEHIKLMLEAEIVGVTQKNLFSLTYKGFMKKYYDYFSSDSPNEYFSKRKDMVGQTFGAIFPDGINEYQEELIKINYRNRKLSPKLREKKISEEIWDLQDKLRKENPKKYLDPKSFV